jgi:uncharacterized protein (TIGR03067 family)
LNKRRGIVIVLPMFDGTWKTVSGKLGTETIPLPDTTFVVAGERYEVMSPSGTDGGRLDWGAGEEVRTVDLVGTRGEHAGNTIQALARVKGDILQLCYAVDGSGRPRDFSPPAGAAVVTVRYRRVRED